MEAMSIYLLLGQNGKLPIHIHRKLPKVVGFFSLSAPITSSADFLLPSLYVFLLTAPTLPQATCRSQSPLLLEPKFQRQDTASVPTNPHHNAAFSPRAANSQTVGMPSVSKGPVAASLLIFSTYIC